MATEKAKPAAPSARSASSLEPALNMSTIIEEKHLAFVLSLTVINDNEGQETELRVGSAKQNTLARTFYPFFLHIVFVGLVPPFFDFFFANLDHYQIRALHLHSNSFLLLSIFAFYCEVFVGVAPSVALLHHFFYLRMRITTQYSGCVYFVASHGSNALLRARKKVDY